MHFTNPTIVLTHPDRDMGRWRRAVFTHHRSADTQRAADSELRTPQVRAVRQRAVEDRFAVTAVTVTSPCE